MGMDGCFSRARDGRESLVAVLRTKSGAVNGGSGALARGAGAVWWPELPQQVWDGQVAANQERIARSRRYFGSCADVLKKPHPEQYFSPISKKWIEIGIKSNEMARASINRSAL